MKKQALSLSLLLMGTLLADAPATKPAAPAAAVKSFSKEEASQLFKQVVRTVDPFQVLQQLEAWKDLQAEMETEGKRRSDQMQKLAKKGGEIEKQLQTMGTTVKDSVKEAKQLEMYRIKQDLEIQEKQAQSHLQQMYEKGQADIYKEIEAVAKEIAQEEGILEIQAGGFLYADPSLDITNAIANRLNKRYRSEERRVGKECW